MPRFLQCATFALAAVCLSGCAMQNRQLTSDLYEQVGGDAIEIGDTNFYPQSTDQCGPAALATVLNSSGINALDTDIAPALYLPERQGSLQVELVAVARKYARTPYPLDPNATSIVAELQAGRPVLVMQNLGTRLFPTWHFAVVVGYQPTEQQFVLRSGTVKRHLVATSRFLRSWERANNWAIVLLRPGELPAKFDEDRYLKAVVDLESVGQYPAALSGFRTLTEQAPRNPTAWFGLGNAYYQSGNLAAAKSAFEKSVELEPNNVAALNNLATATAELGDNPTALALVNRAISVAEPEDSYYPLVVATRSEILQ